MCRSLIQLFLLLSAVGVQALDAQVGERAPADETAAFVTERLSNARRFESKFALLEHSLALVDPSLKGMYCEFGVGAGTTINFIAEKINDSVIHGFDSFEGLPEDWRPGYPKGTFKRDAMPHVRSNVRLHKGWFKDTLPGFVSRHRDPVAFLHLDADLYSSTRSVLLWLGDTIVSGTVIQLDEYYNYPGWKKGEYLAFEEFVSERGVEFEYIGSLLSKLAERSREGC